MFCFPMKTKTVLIHLNEVTTLKDFVLILFEDFCLINNTIYCNKHAKIITEILIHRIHMCHSNLQLHVPY